MARRKQTRRRRTPSFSILNALESLTYAEILSRGTTGTGLWSFVTDEGDIEQGTGENIGGIWVEGEYTGTAEISLADLMQNPSVAITTVASNFASNIVPMAGAMFGTHLTFTVGKRILRKPLNKINRTLVYPLLGKGVRI
jgi:hypothetical protein